MSEVPPYLCTKSVQREPWQGYAWQETLCSHGYLAHKKPSLPLRLA